MSDEVQKLAAILAASRRMLIFTGAGISTGSGIPDYRGPQGVWKTKRPVYFQDFLASEAARAEYWEFKLESWDRFRDAEPNAVHRAVVVLERAERLLLCVTQNVDGLHARAGTSPERLVEVHGTNLAIECLGCGARSDPVLHFEAFARTREIPVCDACGGWLKPATISFGQSLRQADIDRSFAAAAEADLVVALGTTLSVTPAANVPLVAAERGVAYVIINRGPTEHDRLPFVTLRIEGDVAEYFPMAVKELGP